MQKLLINRSEKSFVSWWSEANLCSLQMKQHEGPKGDAGQTGKQYHPNICTIASMIIHYIRTKWNVSNRDLLNFRTERKTRVQRWERRIPSMSIHPIPFHPTPLHPIPCQPFSLWPLLLRLPFPSTLFKNPLNELYSVLQRQMASLDIPDEKGNRKKTRTRLNAFGNRLNAFESQKTRLRFFTLHPFHREGHIYRQLRRNLHSQKNPRVRSTPSLSPADSQPTPKNRIEISVTKRSHCSLGRVDHYPHTMAFLCLMSLEMSQVRSSKYPWPH